MGNTIPRDVVQWTKSLHPFPHRGAALPTMHEAVHAGDPWLLNYHILHNGDVNVRDSYDFTSLHVAAFRGEVACMQTLLAHGARVDLRDKSKMTPLHVAAREGHYNFIRFLLSYYYSSIDLDSTDVWSWTPAMHAVINQHYNIVELLIDHNCNVNIPDEDKRTLLHIAASYGSLKVVKLLIDAGANIDDADKRGRTALHFAAANNNHSVLVELLRRNCDMNKKNYLNKTALLNAAFHNNINCVKELIFSGAYCSVCKVTSKEIDIVHLLSRKALSVRQEESSHAYEILELMLTADGGKLSEVHIAPIREMFITKPSLRLLKLVKLFFAAGMSDETVLRDSSNIDGPGRSLWQACTQLYAENEMTLQQICTRNIRLHMYNIHNNVVFALLKLEQNDWPRYMLDKLFLQEVMYMDIFISSYVSASEKQND